ncbi:hypothetical protein [Streptomyces sp. NPDC052036]
MAGIEFEAKALDVDPAKIALLITEADGTRTTGMGVRRSVGH